MQTIQAFLDTSVAPQRSFPSADFSDWLFFQNLTLQGDALQFVDLRMVGQRGPHAAEITVRPGVYTIECRGVRYGSDARVAAMRAYPQDVQPRRASKLTTLSGAIAVVDSSILEAGHLTRRPQPGTPLAVAEWEPGKIRVPCVQGGFGERPVEEGTEPEPPATFDVFELHHKDTVVGLEIVFIDEDTAYPG